MTSPTWDYFEGYNPCPSLEIVVVELDIADAANFVKYTDPLTKCTVFLVEPWAFCSTLAVL